MAKARVHTVVVRLTFSKPISRADAVREASDNIHGKQYCSFGWEHDEPYPDTFKIGTIKSYNPTKR